MNAPAEIGTLDRATYIGSSDIAGILGASPWATPLDVYLRKTGEANEPPSPEKERIFRRGKRLEPIVLDMLAEEHGTRIVKRSGDANPNRYLDPEHAFMAAEIDAEADEDGEIVNVEVKTVHPFAAGKWGEIGTDEVPIEYAAQVMYGLMVTGRRRAIVAALVGADNLLVYRIERDEETIAGIRAKALAFWHDHILARRPPEPSNMADIMKLFGKVNGRPVEADDGLIADLTNLKRIRGNIRALEGDKEEIEFRICSAICQQWGNVWDPEQAAQVDDAVIMCQGVKLATWKRQSRESVDTKRLKAEQPDIASRYTRITVSRPLMFPKK